MDFPLLLCYPRCGTCRKAMRWLAQRGVAVRSRDIAAEPPTAAELEAWIDASGMDARRFFNTSGRLYRELGLAGRLAAASREQTVALLASDGMLVKRPLLVLGERVLVGFREQEWAEALER